MGIPITTITSDGERMDPTVELRSLEIRKELDRIPEAHLVLFDGSVADRRFEVSNTAFFAPGRQVRVELRDGDAPDAQVFEGLVLRQAVQAHPEGLELRVELADAAIALTRRRRSAVHRQQRDDDIVRALITGAGLKPGTLDPTKVQHAELVQFQTSDWDFMVSRADVNGQVVFVDDGEVSVRAMATAEPARARLEYGLDVIHEFELELDAGEQWASVTSAAWDPGQQALSTPAEAAPVEIAAGNLDVAAVAGKIGGDRRALLLAAPLSPAELGAWADARLARSRLALLRGRMVVDGRTDLRPLDRLELAGVGDRFDGLLLISRVIQRVDQEGWRTELQLGLSPEWFARTPDLAEVAAGGLLPPVLGLQIGVVAAFEDDPLGEDRIRVRLPALDHKDDVVWARLARPDAGDARGFAFWPEPSDEVVVGFLAGDPRQAIVLGALHGSAHRAPAAGARSEANDQRAIVSRGGTMIAFDDRKRSLTIATPGRNTVVIDDEAASITVQDQHGNAITMDVKGIRLASAGDLSVEARGKVTITGTTVDIQ